MLDGEDILNFSEKMQCQELHMVIDNPTGLKGVVAIHNTNLGPALGGCRFIEYPSTTAAVMDAIRLAQGMTYKSAMAGLPLGGGKAVLLKPKKPIDRITYFEALGRFIEKLQGHYITAVDSGTSIEDMDVIATQTSYVTSTSHSQYSNADPSPMTAYGVMRGIEASVKYKLNKKSLKNIHVAVQGLGHVGYNLVRYLVDKGAHVTVFDIAPEKIIQCHEEFGTDAVATSDELFSLDCDVFSPCALGAILNAETIPMIKAPIIAGAANNQLEDPMKDAESLQEKDILYAPDFVLNAGGIIYVYSQHINIPEEEAKNKVDGLHDTLIKIFERAHQENKTTYEIAHRIAVEKIEQGKI